MSICTPFSRRTAKSTLGVATALASALSFATVAKAETPRVVTDIPPVQSLVAMVMGDFGTPEGLLRPGASAHEFALRPSQARALSTAELVVWIGPELSPGLGRQIEALSEGAHVLTLAAAPETQTLPFRNDALFEHAHSHDDDAHDDHAGDAHDDHGHDDHAGDAHDDHGHDEHAGDAHDDHGHEDHAGDAHDDHGHDDHVGDAHDDHGHEDHAAIDPHLWLSPANATVWLSVIADELAELDPDNAAAYRANAEAGAARIAASSETAAAALAPLSDVPLGVAHDAFQYFEAAFGLTIAGAITDGDDAAPTVARMDRLRAAYAETPPVCFLTEPGTDTDLIAAVVGNVFANGTIRTAELDPLGAALPQGAALYPALIEDLATRIATCAAAAG